MIRILLWEGNGRFQKEVTLDQLPVLLKAKQGFLWLDMAGVATQSYESLLTETFGFHPLAVDDALNEVHIAKIDDWDSYLYLVLHDIVYQENGRNTINSPELDIFVGKQYLVTYHVEPIAALERVFTYCQKDERFFRQGPDHLLYRLVDELVNDYITAFEKMEELLNHIEDEVFDNPSAHLLETIFTLKRQILQLRRIVSPQREVLNKLARDEYKVIDPKDRVFFRDVYDHMIRLYDLMESLRDLVSGVLDTYLSVVNNRMNDVMKVLTLITTLFLPLSFITGFFGMNFFQAADVTPFWTGTGMFLVMLLSLALIPATMYGWMRRRNWVASEKI